jgi:hypothetical protein
VPAAVDWWFWRLLASERLTVSLAELEERWSMTDVLDAHEVLDMYDDLEAKAAKRGGR